MAQALVITTSNPYLRGDMEAFKIVCDWQGTSDMAVSLGIAAILKKYRIDNALKAPFPERIRGRVLKVETAPGNEGDKLTYCPYGTYALTLLDSMGLDILDGTGAARSITATEVVVWDVPVPIDEDLTFTIASTATTDQLAGTGAFTGAATSWTLGAGWSYHSNDIHKAAGSGTATCDTGTFDPIANRVYELTFTIGGWATAVNRSLTPSIGATDGTAITADGTYTQIITATNTTILTFTPTGSDAANVACTLDSVSVKYSTPKGRAVIHII
jgi:hypothetical protein